MVNGEGVVTREGRAIQRQSIWCVSPSCLSRSSNHIQERDPENQMSQIPDTGREILDCPPCPHSFEF